MSKSDPDGRITQAVSDRIACLSMDIHESLRESAAELQALLDQNAKKGDRK